MARVRVIQGLAFNGGRDSVHRQSGRTKNRRRRIDSLHEREGRLRRRVSVRTRFVLRIWNFPPIFRVSAD